MKKKFGTFIGQISECNIILNPHEKTHTSFNECCNAAADLLSGQQRIFIYRF